MIYCTIILIGLYALLNFASIIGFLKKVPAHVSLEHNKPASLPFCSIVIAARNEEKSMAYICHDLSKQTYPKEKTEFIIIDDHSDDNTAQIINSFAKQDQRFVLIQAAEHVTGKKQALRYALTRSHGDLLLFTDADCALEPEWTETYVAHANTNSASFFFGGIVPQHPKTLSEAFFRLEFIGILAVQNGLARINHAFSCNGANMCITRKFYEQHYNTKESYTSGDDVFLLHNAKSTPNNVVFVQSLSARVKTDIPSTWQEFLNQRIRWSSKAGGYKDPDAIAVAMIVYATCLAMVVSFIGAWCGNSISLYTFFILYIVKTLCDTLIFSVTAHYYETKKKAIMAIPFFEAIYPFYITIIPIFAMLVPTKWKARKIQK